MNELLTKISSYNIFNYLFPGAAFTWAASQLQLLKVPSVDVPTLLLLYYFAGMVISRVGSVICEPLLKRVSFVKYADYGRFVKAADVDPKVELLLEQGNSYRTIVAGLALLLVGWPIERLATFAGLSSDAKTYMSVVLLLVLFAVSFRKQTQFIVKRVETRS